MGSDHQSGKPRICPRRHRRYSRQQHRLSHVVGFLEQRHPVRVVHRRRQHVEFRHSRERSGGIGGGGGGGGGRGGGGGARGGAGGARRSAGGGGGPTGGVPTTTSTMRATRASRSRQSPRRRVPSGSQSRSTASRPRARSNSIGRSDPRTPSGSRRRFPLDPGPDTRGIPGVTEGPSRTRSSRRRTGPSRPRS